MQLSFFAQNDSFTLKVLKRNLSLAEPWYETLHIQSAIFLIMAEPKVNCGFRTFRVKESFWAKKQSCITLKVGIKKWRLFFVFVCFSGRQFFSLSLRKRPYVFKNSNHYFLTTTYPSIGKYDPFLRSIS